MSDIRNEPYAPTCAETEPARILNPVGSGMPLVEFTVNPATFTHISPCRFGAPRHCGLGDTLWSGDCYRYDIYFDAKSQRYALRWQNGGGIGWLVSPDREYSDELHLLRVIAELKDEARRWDCAHMLWQTAVHTAAAAAATGRQFMLAAHREGRIRVRRRHKSHVWYVTETMPDGTVKETYL